MDLNSIKKLAGQTAIYGLSSVVGRILNYLLVPLYTRVFSTEQYGVVTEMYAYVAFLIIILTYGMETAFFKFSSESTEKSKIYSTTLISLITTSTLFIAITSYFSESIAIWLRYPNHTEYVIWFAIIVGLDALSSIPLAKLREQNKAGLFVTANLISIATNIGLNLFFLVYCRQVFQAGGIESNWLVSTFYNPSVGVGYVFISNLVASIAKTLFLFPWIIVKSPLFDKALFSKMFLYAAPLLLAGLAGIINEAIDRVMLKNILYDTLGEKATMEQLGIYGACYKVSMIIAIFIQAFRFAADPFFFAQKANNKNAKEIYAVVMKYFIIACSTIFIGIMLYIDNVMWFVGEDFREGVIIVPILLMANLLLGVYYNLSIWYKLSGQTQYGAYIAIFGATITIAANYILIPLIGYVGSAWATLFCYASMTFASYLMGKKKYPINYGLKKLTAYPLAAVFVYFLSIYISVDSETMKFCVNTLILLGFVFTILYVERKEIKSLLK